MNWNFFKSADVESKDRLKCGQCHVYLPENYLDSKCEYCLGIKSRKMKVLLKQVAKDATAEPGLQPGKCEKCGSVVPGLVSRFCFNCAIKVIYSE